MKATYFSISAGILIGLAATLYISDAISNYNFWNCQYKKDHILKLGKGIFSSGMMYYCVKKDA